MMRQYDVFAARTSKMLLSLFAAVNSSGNGNKNSEALSTSSASVHQVNLSFRSNATHILWKNGGSSIVSSEGNVPFHLSHKQQQQRLPEDETSTNASDNNDWLVQTRQEAEHDCLRFLKENLMAFDLPFRETLGFPVDHNSSADGLDFGLIQPTIRLALDAKIQFPWTDALPRNIFYDYVLNYANLNEVRTNWRPLLVDALQFNTSELYRSGEANISSVTTWVNTQMWSKLARNPTEPIFFKSSQTPLIFDPMSTIAFGYASCTGTSILFCNALRAVGVPARVAGTPAWYGNATQGNHNWVEVYVGTEEEQGDGWKFLEPSPALPHVDSLEADPCDRWFCDPSRYPSSKVYAAKMSRVCRSSSRKQKEVTIFFPLAWERDCTDVPAVNRTDYYTRICKSCQEK